MWDCESPHAEMLRSIDRHRLCYRDQVFVLQKHAQLQRRSDHSLTPAQPWACSTSEAELCILHDLEHQTLSASDAETVDANEHRRLAAIGDYHFPAGMCVPEHSNDDNILPVDMASRLNVHFYSLSAQAGREQI